MSSFSSEWLLQIRKVSERYSFSEFYLIVDQAGEFPKINKSLDLLSPKIHWCSLFEDEPEGVHINESPLLLKIGLDCSQHLNWFKSLLEESREPERFLLFFAYDDFYMTATFLKKLIVAEWASRSGIFRFYDTRIFSKLISEVLCEEQLTIINSLPVVWGWCNRCLEPVWYKRSSHTPTDEYFKLTLSDSQIDKIGLIGDIERFLNNETFYDDAGKEYWFNFLWKIAKESNDIVIDFKALIDSSGLSQDFIIEAQNA